MADSSSNTRTPLTRLVIQLMVVFFVMIWTLPTFGLLISSLRDKDQLASSGWWTALSTTVRNEVIRLPSKDSQIELNDGFVIEGNMFEQGSGRSLSAWGINARAIEAYRPGETINLDEITTLRVENNGDYFLNSKQSFGSRGQRVFHLVDIPPRFTFENYIEVLTSEGIGQSFINSMVVTLPATFIPILIAAVAAYCLAWMDFRGRFVLLGVIVALLVVPLQMSLIPILKIYTSIGQAFGVPGKSFPGIWLAHTGFGLPLAIYLLRNYMAGLPRDIMESAYLDGATHFQIFTKIVLPLSLPALASFGIFQFLWVWNDLLVALVYLGQGDEKTVLTSALRELLGSRGGNWEILTAGAFVSILVPLIVFLSMQRYFVRGLLAGSVKGG